MATLRDYIITRMLLTIPMLFVLVTLVFIVVRIMPGDPVEAMLRPGVPKEYKDQIKHNLGLDVPLFFNMRGSSARVLPKTLFLRAKPGTKEIKALRVEAGEVVAVSNRKNVDGDWLQVAVPENFEGWVSPDQMAWMRQVNTAMTPLGEGRLAGSESWSRFAMSDGLTGDVAQAIWAEPSGLLWLGADQGLSRYNSANGWETFDELAGHDVRAVWSGRPADTWFGTAGAGIFRFRSNKWSSFTTADGLPSDNVYAIWGKGSRTIWAGTDHGAALYDGQTWTAFTTAEGLAGNQVYAIWGDGKSTYWFGTDKGVSRFDGKEWTSFTSADGLANDQVNAVWGDVQGAVWAGTGSGLSRYDGQTWTTVSDVEGLSDSRVNGLWGNGQDTLWAATTGGLFHYDGQTWESFHATDGLASDKVLAVFRDKDGMIWAGTDRGLSRFDNRPWVKLRVPEGGIEGWAKADQFDIKINPFDSQYFNYLSDLLHFNLGVSLAPTRGRAILADLKLKFPATVELSIVAMMITAVIGILTGTYAAHKRRSLADYSFRFYSIVIYAIPVFWLGLMFQLIFGVYMKGWYETSAIGHALHPIFGNFLPLPISGRIETGLAPKTITGLYLVDSILTGNKAALVSTIRHLLLPAVTLGLYLSGVFTRLTRSNMLDVLQEDYITAARARGITERAVVYKHALKNAFIPILTMMGLQFSLLLAGAVLTETTFSWPGMGLFMVERIGYRDFPSIQGSVIFFALLVASVSLLVDVIYAAIDPRIRY